MYISAKLLIYFKADTHGCVSSCHRAILIGQQLKYINLWMNGITCLRERIDSSNPRTELMQLALLTAKYPHKLK